jgi:GNAT superfamily N-acetyltransferase
MVYVVRHEPPDVDAVKELYESHWWWAGRSLDDIERALEGSDAYVGIHGADDGELLGSARVVTDYVYTAWVMDVIVRDDYRGEGVGREVMAAVCDHPDLASVNELILTCREGVAPFYERCGFEVHEMIDEERGGDGEDYFVMVHS